MEYTKGKWKVIKNDLGLLSVQDPNDKRIKIILSATREGHQAGLTPKQANLIAAAPLGDELATAVLDANFDDYDDFLEIQDLAKKFRAKAEGR